MRALLRLAALKARIDWRARWFQGFGGRINFVPLMPVHWLWRLKQA